MDGHESKLFIESKTVAYTVAYYDVSNCVKSWGRRGILGGGLVGFVLGVALVAIPHSTNILTFGVAGTLIVAVVEGAVIAGAFGACAAALYSKGVIRIKATSIHRPLPSGRRPVQPGRQDGDVPSPDWPARWEFPTAARVHRTAERFTPLDGAHHESHH